MRRGDGTPNPRNAERYNELLSGTDLRLPFYGRGDVFNQYCVKADRRDELQEHLKSNGIGSAIYYPLSLHEQECFSDLGYGPGDFPVSERCARESLAIPVYPELGESDALRVASAIRGFLD